MNPGSHTEAEFGAVGVRLVRLDPASGSILRMPAPHLHCASGRKSRSGSLGCLSDEELAEILATRESRVQPPRSCQMKPRTGCDRSFDSVQDTESSQLLSQQFCNLSQLGRASNKPRNKSQRRGLRGDRLFGLTSHPSMNVFRLYLHATVC